MEVDKQLFEDIFKSKNPTMSKQSSVNKMESPMYEKLTLRSQGSKQYQPFRQSSNDYFTNQEASTPIIRDKTVSLPVELQQQKMAFQISDNSSMKSSYMVSSPKNIWTQHHLNSFTSISTQSSGNNNQVFGQYQQQKYDTIVDHRVQRACSQTDKNMNFLEQSGFKMHNTCQKNIISPNILNERTYQQTQQNFNQTNMINYNIPPTSSNILNSQQFKNYNRQSTADSLPQSQDLTSHINSSHRISNYSQQEKISQKEQLSNYNPINNINTNQNSIQSKFNCYVKQSGNEISDRLNHFQTQQNFYKTNANTFLPSPILSHDLNLQVNYNKIISCSQDLQQTNFASAEKQQGIHQSRDESIKKELLKKMIENRQKELDQLKQVSQSLRQNSIDSYKEINKKIKEINKQQKVNQNFQSSAKLNTYILGRFNSSGDSSQKNSQQQQQQQQQFTNTIKFHS